MTPHLLSQKEGKTSLPFLGRCLHWLSLNKRGRIWRETLSEVKVRDILNDSCRSMQIRPELCKIGAQSAVGILSRFGLLEVPRPLQEAQRILFGQGIVSVRQTRSSERVERAEHSLYTWSTLSLHSAHKWYSRQSRGRCWSRPQKWMKRKGGLLAQQFFWNGWMIDELILKYLT